MTDPSVTHVKEGYCPPCSFGAGHVVFCYRPDPSDCSACGHDEHQYWDSCRRAGCACVYRPVTSDPSQETASKGGPNDAH